MDRIAFIVGDTFVYWSSIILTLATATAICFFLATYLGKSGNGVGAALTIPLALVASLVLARLVHWYSRADSYLSFEAAMTDYTSGGYALVGVFAGCILAAVLLRILFIVRNLPELLDSLSVGGAAGIAVGRLACFFNASDRGQIIESVQELPWVYPVVNAVSGAMELSPKTVAASPSRSKNSRTSTCTCPLPLRSSPRAAMHSSSAGATPSARGAEPT